MKRSEFFALLGIGAAAAALPVTVKAADASDLKVGDYVRSSDALAPINQVVNIHVGGSIVSHGELDELIRRAVSSSRHSRLHGA